MWFSVLGTLVVRDTRGERVALGGPRQQAVLSALVVRRGSMVSLDRLVEDVWGQDLPDHPERTLRTYVSRVRGLLDDPGRLVREGGGYRLDVADDEFDLAQFEALREEGRRLLAAGNVETAENRLREALDLWRGQPLAGLEGTPLVERIRPELQEAWFATVEDHIDAGLATGNESELVGRLRTLVETYPMRERLRAQLMRALYQLGRQAEALAVFRDTRQTLIDELGVEPSAQLVDVHERILRQDPSMAPARPAAGPVPAQGALPRPLTSFVGRGAEVIAIDALLDEGPLVTVTGVGGGGKTRLALEVARGRGDRHEDGVRFVALASVDEASLVGQAVADAIGVTVSGPDVAVELAAYLADRELLVVVDNCEHVRTAMAKLVEHLLGQCVGLRVLATSRQPLGAVGEQVWRLPPLRTPPDGRGLPVEESAAYEAVRLFDERAHAANPSFVLDERSAPSVARICRRLAGIPLAIELAASRTRTLRIDELATRLERSMSMLRSTSPTTDERHQTLQTTLDWSHDLLEEPARALLRRLGVFRSAFSLAALEKIARAEGWAQDTNVVHVLDRLVACSLVEADTRPGVEAPYRMLEPVRLYAAKRLEDDEDDPAAIRAAHAAWWIERMDAVTARLRQGAAGPDVALGDQVNDLRAALRWTVAGGQAELAQRLVAACYVFWWAFGLMREGIVWVHQALDLSAKTPPEVRGSALAGLALLEAHIWPDPAREHAEEAHQLLTGIPEPRRPLAYVDALQALSHVHITSGDVDAGERIGHEAVALGEAARDHWSQGMARSGLALAAVRRGELDEAYAMFEHLHGWSRDLGATLGVIATGYHLGMIALDQGRYDLTRQHLEQVIGDKERTGCDPFGRSHGHLDEREALARACLGQGDTEAARRHATDGLRTARQLAAEDDARRFAKLLDDLDRAAVANQAWKA